MLLNWVINFIIGGVALIGAINQYINYTFLMGF